MIMSILLLRKQKLSAEIALFSRIYRLPHKLQTAAVLKFVEGEPGVFSVMGV